MAITCEIQPTDIVTMAMLHNNCNMCINDLLDMHGCRLWAHSNDKTVTKMEV